MTFALLLCTEFNTATFDAALPRIVTVDDGVWTKADIGAFLTPRVLEERSHPPETFTPL